MENSLIESLRNSFYEKITVYLDDDTKGSLLKDQSDFEIEDTSKFINRLIENYVTEYFDMVYGSIPDIKRKLEEADCEIDDIDQIAKSIAFAKSSSVGSANKLSEKINFRLQKKVRNKAIEALCNGPTSLDISSFFRSMFLFYLSYPVYKREQIIYKQEIDSINRIIRNSEKMNYTNKDNNNSHSFNPYMIDHSPHELFNYLIGQFDHGDRHNTSIRISKIKDIVPVHEKSFFSGNFEECYEVIRQNGIQFGSIDKVVIRKVVLNEDQYRHYHRKYLDRPVIIKEKIEDGKHICYFNCSEFQLKTYFIPFESEDNRISIELA